MELTLAPMQGLTEVVFRRVYQRCFPKAIGSAVAPFISLTRGIPQDIRSPKYADVLPENNAGSIPIVPQLLGKETEEFVSASNTLYEMGHQEVNWNIGCPMRHIVAKHRGCGILPYPDEIRAILDSVIPRMKPRLSIKMRIGLRNKDEILAVAPLLNDYPLASVCIHPRLGRQQYNGHPDLDTFGEAMSIIKHPVVYNGDILTARDARLIHERFPGIAGIMVGRGILYSPTLPLEIAGLTIPQHDKSRMHKQFVSTLAREIRTVFKNEESAIRKTKEYWCLLWKSLGITEEEARKVLREDKLEHIEKMIATFTQ